MTALLAWSQDDFLARRSGYHILADYLDAPSVVTQRADPSGGAALLGTRVLRRASLSRWFTGGSAKMELNVWSQCRAGFAGPIHMLWCDRDIGFLDLLVDHSKNPLIGTFHHPPNQLDQIIRYKNRLRKFRAIILMSESQRTWFLDQGVQDNRIHVIPHGVDTQFYVPSHLDVRPSPVFRVLAVGSTGRDFPRLLETALHFGGRKNIHFEILGPASKKSAFDNLENVTYLNGVSDAQLLSSYQNASCLLHLTTEATANNVLLEALACGLPVIASRVGGVPEYLDFSCGLLVEPASTSSCIQALESWVSNPTNLTGKRYAARAHAESLSWSGIAILTKAIYQNLNY
jgi:glycosyltransferase involved in cell wall biosynthesis